MAFLSPWQFTNLRAVNWRKMFKLPLLCSIWYRSVNPILCKDSFGTRQTYSATKCVYFRSCIIRQWLRTSFVGLVSSHDELLLYFSSKQGEPSNRPGDEVWVEEQLFGDTFSRHPQISLVTQHPDPLYLFLNKLSRFVFHKQSACELSECFQREHCSNWMDSWHLILVPCAKH